MDHSSMSGMSSSSSSSSSSTSGMMTMNMVFHTSHTTPLFSSAWTPTSIAGYAGTCIFLIVLAAISRLLMAYRHILELKWHDRAVRRRYVVLAGESAADRERQTMASAAAAAASSATNAAEAADGVDALKEEGTLTVRGMDESVRVVRSVRPGLEVTPWRFSTDLPRACTFTVQAGISYLLMLAVMTLNVGYFLSVLGGLFLGELLVGRYTHLDDGQH